MNKQKPIWYSAIFDGLRVPDVHLMVDGITFRLSLPLYGNFEKWYGMVCMTLCAGYPRTYGSYSTAQVLPPGVKC